MLDRRGRALGSAAVVIVGSSVAVPEIAILTDEAGGFTMRLPSGRYVLRAHGPDGSGEVEAVLPGSEDVRIHVGR